jgi:hypothetical protein
MFDFILRRFAVTAGVTIWISLSLATRPALSAPQAADECIDAHEQSQVLRRSGHLLQARDGFKLCSQRECPEVVRTDCVRWFLDVSRELPSVVVAAREGETQVVDASLYVDGRLVSERLDGAPLELDPGLHRFRLVRSGWRNDDPCPPHSGGCIDQQQLVLAEQQGRLLEFRFEGGSSKVAAASGETAPFAGALADQPLVTPDKYRPIPWYGYVLAGSSVAMAISAATLWRLAESDASRLDAECRPFCSEAQLKPLHQKLFWSDVSAVASAGLLGGAVLAFVTRPTVERRNEPYKTRARSLGMQISMLPIPQGAWVGVAGDL